jgi:hypothetical protein
LTALGAARPYVDRGGADDRGHHIRFFTWYDYEIRFGIFGKLIDRWVFRPLLGWATASLDFARDDRVGVGAGECGVKGGTESRPHKTGRTRMSAQTDLSE